MHSPFDYQLDYLSATHLIYQAFPTPLEINYFKLSNPDEVLEATEVTKSQYAHALHNTSISKYDKINNLPAYFTQSGESKVLSANEFGNIYNQQEITLIIPAIYGFRPRVGEFVNFAKVGPDRLFIVDNVETSNIMEDLNTLQCFKIKLKIDQHFLSNIENRIDYDFTFNKKLGVVLKTSDSLKIESILKLIELYLKQIDLEKEIPLQINKLLSKMYSDYKNLFEIVLQYGNFSNMQLLNEFEGDFFVHYKDNPDVLNLIALDKIDTSKLISDLKEINDGNLTANNKFNLILNELDNDEVKINDYIPNSNILDKTIFVNILMDYASKILKG